MSATAFASSRTAVPAPRQGCPRRSSVGSRVDSAAFDREDQIQNALDRGILAIENVDLAAARHDEDAVGMLDHLFEIGRDQNHPHALIAEAPDRLKDFLLGAEVDAPGRFVEQQDLGFPVEPFSKHELLLISSRQIKRLGIEPFGIESKLPGESLAPLARLAPVDDGPGGNGEI